MLFTLIEKSLNYALALDTRSPQRLMRLQGKCIEISFTRPHLSAYLFFTENSVLLQESLMESVIPDTVISGPLRAFMQLTSNHDIQAAKTSGLKIAGDMDLAEQCKILLMDLDMDWEEPLSSLTGDVFAHTIGKMLKNFQHKRKTITDKIFQNISEYFKEESGILSTDTENNEYIKAVDKLNCDLDRLSANITEFKNSDQKQKSISQGFSCNQH